MDNFLSFFIADSVLTIGIIVLVIVVFVKKIISSAFTGTIIQVKNNPERFRENIEGSDFTKDRIIQTLKEVGRIKKMKVLKSDTPQFRSVEMTTKSVNGEEQKYHVNFIIKDHRAKITDISRFL